MNYVGSKTGVLVLPDMALSSPDNDHPCLKIFIL